MVKTIYSSTIMLNGVNNFSFLLVTPKMLINMYVNINEEKINPRK